MSEKVDISDLTDEVILKILIDRERQIISSDRQGRADSKAEDEAISAQIRAAGTDEG